MLDPRAKEQAAAAAAAVVGNYIHGGVEPAVAADIHIHGVAAAEEEEEQG